MYVRFNSTPESRGVEIPLSAGMAGTDETVQLMAAMTRRSLLDPVTKAAAMKIAAQVRPQDVLGYIRAVWAGVKTNMTYVPDVAGQEELTSPAIHSARIMQGGKSYGDCDDFSMLGAAWLLALGVPARFDIVASPKNGGRFDHVRVDALGPQGWIPLETTMRKMPFGFTGVNLRNKLYAI